MSDIKSILEKKLNIHFELLKLAEDSITEQTAVPIESEIKIVDKIEIDNTQTGGSNNGQYDELYQMEIKNKCKSLLKPTMSLKEAAKSSFSRLLNN